MPVIYKEDVKAAIAVDEPGEKREFTEREIRLVRGIASQAAIAIENARLYEDVKHGSALSTALANIGEAILSAPSISAILNRLLAGAAKAIEADSIFIGRWEKEEGDWLVESAYNLPGEIGRRYPDTIAYALTITAEQKQPFISEDVWNDPRPVNKEYARRNKIRAYIITLLIVRGEAIGAISFQYHGEPRAFTEKQLEFAEKLSTAIFLALENARLYETQRDIADTLQTALLTVPERIEGVEYGYLYRSATEATRVGGDFFDIFELEHGRVGVVGDVAGKGLEAATLTSLARNTIRAYAYEEASPGVIMAKVNEAVIKATQQGSFITVFFGIVDTKADILTYCSAGHPPAMVKRGDEVSILGIHNTAIGAFKGLTYQEAKASLKKGDMLILYTDGAIEARCNGGFFAESGLISALKGIKTLNTGEVPQAIFNEITRCSKGKISDDIVLLSIRTEVR